MEHSLVSTSVLATREAGFLKAIIDEPDDDAHRLIYADWLDENSGTVQCRQCNVRPYAGRPWTCECGDCGEYAAVVWRGPGRDSLYCRLHNPGKSCVGCNGTGLVLDDRSARAEFIRVQCELVTMPVAMAEKKKWAGIWSTDELQKLHILQRRERELLDEHSFTWLSEAFPQWKDHLRRDDTNNFHVVSNPFLSGKTDPDFYCSFHRGFVGSLSTNIDQFMKYAGSIFKQAPIEEVRLLDIQPFETGFNSWQFFPDYYGRRADTHTIPTELFIRLPGIDEEVRRGIKLLAYQRVLSWVTKEEALDALSQACVTYGRALAML